MKPLPFILAFWLFTCSAAVYGSTQKNKRPKKQFTKQHNYGIALTNGTFFNTKLATNVYSGFGIGILNGSFNFNDSIVKGGAFSAHFQQLGLNSSFSGITTAHLQYKEFRVKHYSFLPNYFLVGPQIRFYNQLNSYGKIGNSSLYNLAQLTLDVKVAYFRPFTLKNRAFQFFAAANYSLLGYRNTYPEFSIYSEGTNHAFVAPIATNQFETEFELKKQFKKAPQHFVGIKYSWFWLNYKELNNYFKYKFGNHELLFTLNYTL